MDHTVRAKRAPAPDAAAALGLDFDALPLLAGGRTKAAFRAEDPEPVARDGIAPMILGAQRYFELLAQLAAVVPVDAITWPMDDWTLDEALARIEEEVRPTVIDITDPALDLA